MSTGLILVDIQNDYFSGGSMELVGMHEAAANAATLLDWFRSSDEPRYHVQHLSVREGATFFVPGTPGVEINECVRPEPGEPVTQKHFPNAFRDTGLEQRLKDDGIDHVVICGAMSHMCIDATTRAAFDLGLRCTVIEDACATRDLTFHDRRIEAGAVHAAFMAALAVPYATVAGARTYLDQSG